MTKGVFIFSLDCEGKWGSADRVDPEYDRFITNKNLIKSYTDILVILETHLIKATFGFVSVFTMGIEEYLENEELLKSRSFDGKDWLSRPKIDISQGKYDGWLCPEVLSLVRDDGHEIASHGFCHIPFREGSVSAVDIELEIEGIVRWSKLRSLVIQSFIYPRNLVGFPERVRSTFNGYRGQMQRGRGLISVRKFCEEFNLFRSPQYKTEEGIVPGGYFLNWRIGKRLLVPKFVTIWRWKFMINRACRAGGVIHLWTHPHNFITGADQEEILEEIIKHVAVMREKGVLEVLTQSEYLDSQASQAE